MITAAGITSDSPTSSPTGCAPQYSAAPIATAISNVEIAERLGCTRQSVNRMLRAIRSIWEEKSDD